MISTVMIWLLIGAALIVGGIIILCKTYNCEELAGLMIAMGIVAIVIGAIYGGLLLADRNHERGIYQEYMVEQRDLEAALNNSTDTVVTAELYDKAIEFNKDLAYKQYLYERGGYLAFSGDYDWSAIPSVTIPQ